ISHIPGARVVRIADFLGVVAEDEWDAICASRELNARWDMRESLIDPDQVRDWMQSGPFEGEEFLAKKGDASGTLAMSNSRIRSEFYWPMQTHGSIGPSCAVADVRDGGATIWTASQATHRFRTSFAQFLGLPIDAVRLIYLDGS